MDIQPYRSLSYAEVLDPHIAYKLIQEDDRNRIIEIELFDAYVTMHIRDAIFNLIVWRLYHAFEIPVTADKVIRRITVNASTFTQMETKILEDIRKVYPNRRTEICDAIFKFINYLYNFIVVELNAYVSSISILEIAKLVHHPKVAPLRQISYNPMLGTDVIEKKIAEAGMKLRTLLGDAKELPFEENCMLHYQQTQQLNPNQLTQILLAYGPRTDVDDTIVLHPVMSNTADGITNIIDFAVESLAAKKSSFYNKVAVSSSSYFSRKIQLVTHCILRIYDGDCGTNVYVNCHIKKSNYKNFIGMNMVANTTTGELVCLTEDILKGYIDQEIPIRNPMGCRYTDGVCESCGGTMLLNINHNLVYGILAAINMVSPTVQLILSAKHLVKTLSLIYTLSKDALNYFHRINANEIQWKPSIVDNIKDWSMGVSLKDMGTLHDIVVLTPDAKIKEERFSSIRQIVLKNEVTGEVITLDMEQDDICPFFTIGMLLHIQRFLQNSPTLADNMLWIPLAGTEKISIFKTLVVNDSMMKFVKTVSSFLSSKIKNYVSLDAVLNDFCDIVFTKVSNCHVTHLSTVLKAYMVSSETDYRIPVLTDPNKVMFKTTSMCITKRSLAGQLAYEKHEDYLASPDNYLVPKIGSIFNPFFDI